MLAAFQPVLPALTTVLTHIDAQRTTQARFQASTADGTNGTAASLSDSQEAELHAYDDKISKQVRAAFSLYQGFSLRILICAFTFLGPRRCK